MATFNLTSLENSNDYRIRQNSRYSVIFSMLGDYSSGYTLKGHIKRNTNLETFAVFNIGNPHYDGTKTTWMGWLTPNQTKAIPVTTRNSIPKPTIGKEVWVWDLLLVDLNNGDNNLRIIDPSWVECIPGVTNP